MRGIIARRQQSADQHGRAPSIRWPDATEACSRPAISAGEAAARRQAHERQAAEAERENAQRQRARRLSIRRSGRMAQRLRDKSRRKRTWRPLRMRAQEPVMTPALSRARCLRRMPAASWKDQKEVADLRERRVDDEKFETALAKRHCAAEQGSLLRPMRRARWRTCVVGRLAIRRTTSNSRKKGTLDDEAR